MCNLPEVLILDKMTQLHNVIIKNFQFTPTVFRAGRWGVGPNVIRTIKMMRYQIDTSLPFINWEKMRFLKYVWLKMRLYIRKDPICSVID